MYFYYPPSVIQFCMMLFNLIESSWRRVQIENREIEGVSSNLVDGGFKVKTESLKWVSSKLAGGVFRVKSESLEGISNKLAGGAFKVKTESLEGVSGKLAGGGFQVKTASLEGVSSKWTYIMQTYMYLHAKIVWWFDLNMRRGLAFYKYVYNVFRHIYRHTQKWKPSWTKLITNSSILGFIPEENYERIE